MIIGIGSDIVEHKLTERLNWMNDRDVLDRIFSKSELALFSANKSIRFLAGRFAVKEAVLKCLGIGMQDGVSLKEIQVLKSEMGQPLLEISGVVKGLSNSLGIRNWHISITHTENVSMAFVVAEN